MSSHKRATRYRAANGKYLETIPARLEPGAARAVGEWAKRRHVSRSEAFRRLINLGLAASVGRNGDSRPSDAAKAHQTGELSDREMQEE
jgi:hypothetical protein